MSNEALTWAFRQEDLPTSQKFVLVVLANYADESGSCYPGQEKIHKMTGLSVRSVKYALDALEDSGLISREHRVRPGGRGRTSDRYFLALDYGANIARKDVLGANDDTFLVQPTTLHGATVAPTLLIYDTSVNHQLNTSVKSETIANVDVSTKTAFVEAWSHWPKKTNRKKSEERFIQASKHKDWAGNLDGLVAVVVRFGDAYAATTETRFVPGLETWLFRERWTDPLPTSRERDQEVKNLSVVEFFAQAERKEVAS